MRIFILGALNISLFWSLLFISVYRLPGGVAATVGAVQPLMVVFISAALLGSPIRLMAVLGAICGTAGVALLVLTPNAALDPVGVAAGLAGAASHGVRNRADPQVGNLPCLCSPLPPGNWRPEDFCSFQ
ncbi:EamA family transporter [Escherichia coli]